MFASLFAAMAGQIAPIVIPLQTPPQVEWQVAPIKSAGPLFAKLCDGSDDWDQPAPPVRIFGNTYFVGTCGISSILIRGDEGDILIDAGTEAGADIIAQSIRSLGFKLSGIRILLHSHEHLDHVGGTARMKQLTGAELYASPEAAKVFATGTAGASDPQAGMHKPFPSVTASQTVVDGSVVRLGNLWLTAIATPGHTPGAMSWKWVSCEGGVCRSIVYADSLSPVSSDDYRFSDHPDYVRAYRASIAKIAALDCDILVTPHPSASAMPERFAAGSLEKPDGCRDYAAGLTKRLDERLEREKGK